MSSRSEECAVDAAGAAMEGSGFYNRHSSMQAAGIAKLLPIWEKLLREVAIDGRPLVVADYGSSQGRNSMAPMRIAIEELRGRVGHDLPVQIVHTDLPSNDFASLFEALDSDPNSYLSGLTSVYPSAIGRSYFQPILPPESVTVGWNTWTVHWLSGERIEVPDHVVPGLTRDQKALGALRRRQADDWRLFLESRSVELASGGRLLTAFVTEQPDHTGWEWLCGELWQAMIELERDEILTPEELTRVTVPASTRPIGDIRAPFAEDGRFAGLELDSLDVVTVPDPIWDSFQRSGDRAAFGVERANSLRAWSGPSIAACLAERPDCAEVVDRLYARTAERLAATARPHHPYLAVVGLRKA